MCSHAVCATGGVALIGGALVVAKLGAWHGIFHKVEVEEGLMDEISFVYVEHVGPYKTIGKAFNKLISALKEKGIAVRRDQERFVGTFARSTESSHS